MSHHCNFSVLTCEDFRLHQRKDGRNYIAEFIKGLGEDADLITRAGGVQDLVRPKNGGYKDSIIRDLNVSVKLHNAKTIVLLNHGDCGAYASFGFQDKEDELKQHYADLNDAKDIIVKEFPEVEVKLFFAELEKDSGDVFVINEVK